jgi:photosystem II stability/assembly factor-like uncharacterized protein
MRLRTCVALALAAMVTGLPGGLPTGTAAGGGVWAVTTQATQQVDRLSAFADGTYYVQYLDRYERSRDYGVTWTALTPPTPSPAAVRFASPAIGWSLASGYRSGPVTTPATCTAQSPLYRTTDGGTKWQQVCLLSPPLGTTFVPQPFQPLAIGADGRTVALLGTEEPTVRTTGCEPERGAVYTSHDAGATWTRTLLPGLYQPGVRYRWYDAKTAVLIAYRMKVQDDCSRSGDDNAVFLTTDGGKTFRPVLYCMEQPICTAASMPTRSRIAVGRTDGSTRISDDLGRHWRPGQGLTSLVHRTADPAVGVADMRWAFWVQDVAFADARNGFASTRGSGTWRTSDGGLSWTQERSHECDYYLTGIGEIAAPKPDRAITGGPHWISTRVPAAVSPGGCDGPSPSVPDLAAPVTQVGASALLADGRVLA